MSECSNLKTICEENVTEIQEELTEYLLPGGFECHPFKVGWYNDKVSSYFQLPYHQDTIAFITISTPTMFEKTFLPYLLKISHPNDENKCPYKWKQDPLDTCMLQQFSQLKEKFLHYNLEILHDFDLTYTKRPKVLVQTAGHVSGAVRLYQRKDLKEDPWDDNKKIYGVCMHPSYGGWFALRSVIIFKDIQCPDLLHKEPKNMLENDCQLRDLLSKYNENWTDWTFRDVISAKERYSERQIEYFTTTPGEARQLLLHKYAVEIPTC